MEPKSIWSIVKHTFKQWSEDKASRLAASLSFYTMLSLAPLLVIVVAIAGFVFGTSTAQEQIVGQINSAVGEQGAEVARTMLQGAAQPNVASIAGIIGLLTLIWGASNVFAQLQEAMDIIWDVEPKPDLGLMARAKSRLLSFSIVVGIGFLLLVSLVISAALVVIGNLMADLLPGGAMIWQLVNQLISLAVIMLLFAMMYKVLPDANIAWRDVWLGAFVTAVLFTIGKYLLGLYLGFQSYGSTYGAAGSLVALLVWIYYSAQIFFFGAEFTQVYATHYGRGIEPSENARLISSRAGANPHRPRGQAPAATPATIVYTEKPREKTGLWQLGAALMALLFVRNRRTSR